MRNPAVRNLGDLLVQTLAPADLWVYPVNGVSVGTPRSLSLSLYPSCDLGPDIFHTPATRRRSGPS